MDTISLCNRIDMIGKRFEHPLSTRTMRLRNPMKDGVVCLSCDKHDGRALEWIANVCLYFGNIEFLVGSGGGTVVVSTVVS